MRLQEFFKTYEPIDHNVLADEGNLLRYIMFPKTDQSSDIKKSMFPEDRIWTVILDTRMYIVPGNASTYTNSAIFGSIICKEPWSNADICVEVANLIK